MFQLVDKVLLISRADSNQLVYQPIPTDLEQFCHELVEEFQITLTEQHHLVFTNQGDYGETNT